MPHLRDKDSGRTIGTISEEELAFLVEALEETSDSDTDYYIDSDTIDMLEEDGATPNLTTLLRASLDGRDGMDVEWQR